jgi:archaemetzincin
MRPIVVVPVGTAERPLLQTVRAALQRAFRTPCTVSSTPLAIDFARHPERNQYHSTAVLEQLAHVDPQRVLLGVTAQDLYIPILTFVFGEALLGGTCAVVSYHRLTQEFYGLPCDQRMLEERLVKEAIHEIGHTAGLTHCEDYGCVMAASHSVEWLDLKGEAICRECMATVA